MATYYPLITGNVNTASGSSKFDLAAFTDGSFDIYTFEDINGVQSAYLVFVIKNTATGAGQDLTVTSISGNTGFNVHWEFDFVEDGETELHLGMDGSSNNKLKTSPTGTNTSTTDTHKNANASGAAAFFGVNSAEDILGSDAGFTGNAENLNAVGGTNVIAVYRKSDIVSTPIPPNSYAAFVVKYKPVNTFDTSMDMRMFIANSDQMKTIVFSGVSANLLTFSGRVGTAVSTGGGTTFSVGDDIIVDTDTFSIGNHPIGHSWGEEDMTIEFADNSQSPGSYTFTGIDSGTVTSFALEGFQSADGTTYVTLGTSELLARFKSSFKHTHAKHSYLSSAHSGAPVDVTISNLHYDQGASPIYKNLSSRYAEGDSSSISYRSTHRDYETNASPYDDYKHTSESSINIKAAITLTDIINTSYLAQTGEGNKTFLYFISAGFYNRLTMSEAQILYHKNGGLDAIPFNSRYINSELEYEQESPAEGPYLHSSGVGSMTRGSTFYLPISLRYNNYNGSTLEPYILNTSGFDLTASGTDGVAIYSGFSGDILPSHYGTEEFTSMYVDFNTYDIVSGAFHGFSSQAANGNFLELLYPLTLGGLEVEDVYEQGGGVIDYTKIGWREHKFGVFENTYIIGNQGDSNMFKQGLGGHNTGAADGIGVKYRMAFHLNQSTLRLSASSLVNEGGDPDSFYLFYDSSTGNTNSDLYDGITEAQSVATWYTPGTADEVSADIRTKTNYTDSNAAGASLEGDWYGAAGFTVNQPKCWKHVNSRRFSKNTGSGAYLEHNGTNNTIKTTVNTKYSEVGETATHLFSLTDTSYHPSVQKYRSAGRLYFDNTGDYPMYIQNVSIGYSELVISTPNGGLGDTYIEAGLSKMLLPEPNIHYKPDVSVSPSNDPTWTISTSNTPIHWNLNGIGVGVGNTGVCASTSSPGNIEISSISSVGISSSVIGNEYRDLDEGATFVGTRFGDAHALKDKFINISFELDPTNVSTKDQGDYYVQVMVSYYIDDYKNRKLSSVSANGDVTTANILSGTAQNDRVARLHVSKYLVKCTVQAVGVIEVVDSEGDLAAATINLPTLSIG